jgi:predicted CopG family antitoxin
MKIITIEDEAYRSLMRKIDCIAEYVKQQAENAAEARPNTRTHRACQIK